MKSVNPFIWAGRLTSFKMKVLFICTICLGVVFFSTVAVAPTSEDRRSDHVAKLSYMKQAQVQAQVQEQPFQDKADLKTLRLVQVSFRHGDRTPIDRYPKDPYNSRTYWPEGWGQLTDKGKLMQFRLGQYIRNRYDGFLSKVYNPDEIYIQSSTIDRAIMSAMANQAGMWPPISTELPAGANQQFPPVHSISPELDNKIAYTMTCPKYDRAFRTMINQPEDLTYNLQNTELYKQLSAHTGLNITTYFNVSDIYDILLCQEFHNLTLPSWTSEYFPDKLFPFANRVMKSYTRIEEMRILRSSQLITQMVRNMKRFIGNPSEDEKKVLEKLFHTPYAKAYIYSGHDTTVCALLDGLGVYDGAMIPYAASVYLELHQNVENKYYVKLFYRPDIEKSAEELKFSNCKSDPCQFDDFMEMLKSYIKDEKQWEMECSL